MVDIEKPSEYRVLAPLIQQKSVDCHAEIVLELCEERQIGRVGLKRIQNGCGGEKCVAACGQQRNARPMVIGFALTDEGDASSSRAA